MQQMVSPQHLQPVIIMSEPKSMFASYLFWFFFGWAGGHRFYHGKIGSGAAMLILNMIGGVTALFAVGFLILIPMWIWQLIDACLIPGWVTRSRQGSMLLAQAAQVNPGGATPTA